MVVAYLDNGHIVPADVIRAVCKELNAQAVPDFGLVPLYKGLGSQGIGRECRDCGAPLGSVDPDECKYILLGICSECRC